jgi:hypothetical protein
LRSSERDVFDRVLAIAPAPLLLGEKEADYANLASRFLEALKPKDAIEEFLVRDVIDLTWEILRLRRAKAGILKASVAYGVEQVLNDLGYYGDLYGKKWAAGDEGARNQVEVLLTKAGLTIDEVTAKTLESKLDPFERLDRMMASAEARRNNALRELDRHRETLGVAARRAIDEVEDVEFRDVETGETDGAPAS